MHYVPSTNVLCLIFFDLSTQKWDILYGRSLVKKTTNLHPLRPYKTSIRYDKADVFYGRSYKQAQAYGMLV